MWKLTFQEHKVHEIFSVDPQCKENARMEIGILVQPLLVGEPTNSIFASAETNALGGGNFIVSTVIVTFFHVGSVPTGYCFTVLCYLPWAGGSHSNQLQQYLGGVFWCPS